MLLTIFLNTFDGVNHLSKQLYYGLIDSFRLLFTNFMLIPSIIALIIITESVLLYLRTNGDYKSKIFKLLTRFPLLRGIFEERIKSVIRDIRMNVHGKFAHEINYIRHLPRKSNKPAFIVNLIKEYQQKRMLNWEDGFASGTVYAKDKKLDKLMLSVYESTMWTNPLHVDIFPDIRRMEAETVRMVLSMFNGDDDACGTMTSGGTESIILACRAYKERAKLMGIIRPNIIVPVTAHAAFDKAADFFEIDIIHIPVDDITREVNVKAMQMAITKHTCMLAVSAPSFPHGIIDPIEEVSRLGIQYGIPVHVDCCLGGFLLPFMKDAGFDDLPCFDFRLPGITSISCDTHKYGFAPKGTSVIMYRNTEYRNGQYYVAPNWPGGVYASPTLAGSRSGGLIALTWATLIYHGKEGYVIRTREIVNATRFISAKLSVIPGIKVMGDPKVCVVGFTSNDFDIFHLSHALSNKSSGHNWSLNTLQFPSSVHICITARQANQNCIKTFIDDVTRTSLQLLERKNPKESGMAAIYGMSQMIPDRSLISTFAKSFLDACYDTYETANKSDDPVENNTNNS